MKTHRFRRVKNEHGKWTPFKVFIIHGRSNDWRRVKRFIEGKLRFKTEVAGLSVMGGTIISKIRNHVWHDCDCAVAILSADDMLIDKTRNARPNVLFEVGYCMGFFDLRYWEDDRLESVLLIREDKTTMPSDFAGIEYIPYSRAAGEGIGGTYDKLAVGLENIYERVNQFFKDY